MTSEKLQLRPLEKTDAEALRRLLGHPLLTGRRYFGNERLAWLPPSGGDVARQVEKCAAHAHDRHFVVVSRGGDQILGFAGFGAGWDALTPWASVVVDPDQWRRGIGTDAACLVLDYLFDTTPAQAVSNWVAEWNREGLAFASSLGFQATGRVRYVGLRHGEPYDDIPMDLLRPEWRARSPRGASRGA